MTKVWHLLLVACLVAVSTAKWQPHTTTTPRPKTHVEKMHDQMDKLDLLMRDISRQLMLQQLFFNERTRMLYNSGVKQIRYTKVGPTPYHSESHTGHNAGSIYDIPQMYRTLGLGELDVGLNGIDFRTRHNDYKLRMPSHHRKLHDEVDVPLPPVPAAVSKFGDVNKQVDEMREWFRAWQTQNTTHRPYKHYFKPVLCYLEGVWMKEGKKLVEPSQITTHHYEAYSQKEMEQKIRFSAYTGHQNPNGNLAYLPRTIMNVLDQSVDLARWNYRIACHPLKDDLLLKDLRLVDDLSARMANRQTLEKYKHSTAARFDLNDVTKDTEIVYGLLDKVMQEIPGKDNYGAVLKDDILGEKVYEIKYPNNYTAVNTAYYHRWYKVMDKGAMGVFSTHRGFADANLFVARTNMSDLATMSLKYCEWANHKTTCKVATRSYSYAIPLEIIYLTPLHNWNPYHIHYKGSVNTNLGKSVTANNRKGGMTKATAYDGTNSMHWYHTPKEFFSGDFVNSKVDSQKVVGVLDSTGTPRAVMASGIRTLQSIRNIGQVRTRFPIFPVHGEGLGEWKELDALKDVTMKFPQYAALFETDPINHSTPPQHNAKPGVHFNLGKSDAKHGSHTHTFQLTLAQTKTVGDGGTVTVTTSTNSGHSHHLVVYFDSKTASYEIKSCDGHAGSCPDGHPVHLTIVH